MATVKTVSLKQILGAYMVANDKEQTKRLLVEFGIVANMDVANSLSDKDLANAIAAYGETAGNAAFTNLVKSFVINRNANNWTTDEKIMAATIADLKAAGYSPATDPSARSFGDTLQQGIDWLTGSSTSTTNPVVSTSTTTKASPVVIGAIIGGVLLVGILAYVVLKS